MKKNIFVIFFVLLVASIFVESQSTDEILTVNWSNTGKYVILSNQQTLKIYAKEFVYLHSINNVVPEGVEGNFNTGSIISFDWNYDDSKIALTLSFEGTPVGGVYGSYDYIMVYDVPSWELLMYKRRFGNMGMPGIFQPNSSNITIVSQENTRDYIRIYDSETQTLLYELITKINDNFTWNTQNPNNYVRLNNTVITGNILNNIEQDTGIIARSENSVQFNSGATMIAIIDIQENIKVYSPDFSQLILTIEPLKYPAFFAWYEDDIIVFNSDSTVDYWDIETGQSTAIAQNNGKFRWSEDVLQVATIQNGDVTFYTDITQTNIVGQILSSSEFYTSSLTAIENSVNNLIANNSKIGNANVTQIQANVTGVAQSVRFFLNGNPIVDNEAPYTIPLPPVGIYTLSAIPYSQADGMGNAGIGFTVNFEVVDGGITPTLTPPTPTPSPTPIACTNTIPV